MRIAAWQLKTFGKAKQIVGRSPYRCIPYAGSVPNSPQPRFTVHAWHHAQLLDGSLEIWVSEHSPRAHMGTSAGRVRACNRPKVHTGRNRRSVLKRTCDLDMFTYSNLAMSTRHTVALKALLAKQTYGKRLSTLSGAKASIGATVGACYPEFVLNIQCSMPDSHIEVPQPMA